MHMVPCSPDSLVTDDGARVIAHPTNKKCPMHMVPCSLKSRQMYDGAHAGSAYARSSPHTLTTRRHMDAIQPQQPYDGTSASNNLHKCTPQLPPTGAAILHST